MVRAYVRAITTAVSLLDSIIIDNSTTNNNITVSA